jgi:Family of unknown function (DUF5857)
MNNIVTKFPYLGIAPNELPYAQSINSILSLCKTKGGSGCEGALLNICQKNANDPNNPWNRDYMYTAYQNYLNLSQKHKKDPTSLSQNEKNEMYAWQNIFTACGCHLPANQYSEWTRLGVDEANLACDPLCKLPGVLQRYANNQPAVCTQNICILDNISIDIINSQIPGGITFNTLCGNCGGKQGGCLCVFSGINIFQSGSSVGNINFQQNCGGNCQMPDPNQNGNFIPIDCSTGLPIGGGPTPTPPSPGLLSNIGQWLKDHWVITILIILLFIGIVFLVVWLTSKKKKKYKGPGENITLSDLYPNFDDII